MPRGAESHTVRRVTLDTAILVRANGKANGPAGEVMRRIREQGTTLVLSEYILGELERVLQYPRLQKLYGLTADEVAGYVRAVRAVATVVWPATGPRVVPGDAADDAVVYTAVAGRADVLCSLDQHLFAVEVMAFCGRQGIRVMTDVDLLVALGG